MKMKLTSSALAATLLCFTPACDSGSDSDDSVNTELTEAIEQACLEGDTIDYSGVLSATATTTSGQAISISLQADVDLEIEFQENGRTITNGTVTVTRASSTQDNAAAQELVGESITLSTTVGTFNCEEDARVGTSGSFTEEGYTFDYIVRLTSEDAGVIDFTFSGTEENLRFSGSLDGNFTIVESTQTTSSARGTIPTTTQPSATPPSHNIGSTQTSTSFATRGNTALSNGRPTVILGVVDAGSAQELNPF